jgi:hypothetical protein
MISRLVNTDEQFLSLSAFLSPKLTLTSNHLAYLVQENVRASPTMPQTNASNRNIGLYTGKTTPTVP